MRAGKARHRITIQQPTTAAGTYGGKSETWSKHSTVMSGMESMVGREYQGQAKVTSQTTHKFWFRTDPSRAAVTTKMRIVLGSRVFDIQSVVDPTERGAETICMAVEREA